MATTLTAGADSVFAQWDYEIPQSPTNAVSSSKFSYAGKQLTSGTGAGQADRVLVSGSTAIAANGTLTFNLSAFLDPFLQTLAMARVKGIYVELKTTTTALSILVGGAGSNPFVNWITPANAQVRVKNGMCFYLGLCQDATGFLVGSGVNLLLTNEDGANVATVNVRIVGCSL